MLTTAVNDVARHITEAQLCYTEKQIQHAVCSMQCVARSTEQVARSKQHAARLAGSQTAGMTRGMTMICGQSVALTCLGTSSLRAVQMYT